MKGRLDVREIEDIGNSALSFAEVKALAADDPNTLRRAQAQAEVTRLKRARCISRQARPDGISAWADGVQVLDRWIPTTRTSQVGGHVVLELITAVCPQRALPRHRCT